MRAMQKSSLRGLKISNVDTCLMKNFISFAVHITRGSERIFVIACDGLFFGRWCVFVVISVGSDGVS